MSADGLSALAVDDLGRSLMGWQLAGWQFDIAHEPMTVTFLEPGATVPAAPEFAPVPSETPAIDIEDPAAENSPSALEPEAPVALGTNPASAPIMAASDPRESMNLADPYTAAPVPSGASLDGGSAAITPGGGDIGGFEIPIAFAEDPADIFEFNIIFQLNVLLDSDFIVQEIAGASDASLLGLGFGQWPVTGGNTQTNTAIIMDAGDYGDFGWLGGSYYETNAIYSLNALDDGDVAFNLVSAGGLGSVQSITSGGNTQANEATIHSLTGGAGAVPEGVQIGANDTVEYTITTQVNFMNDGDIVGQQILGGSSGVQTANTGGNSQGNTALLIDDNAAPGHDVPGNYYEYNLIYQANVMDDSDRVVQAMTSDAPGAQTSDAVGLRDDEALSYSLSGDGFA